MSGKGSKRREENAKKIRENWDQIKGFSNKKLLTKTKNSDKLENE